MKRFENEVMSFDVGAKYLQKQMRDTLADLGMKGWEVVSVHPARGPAADLLVFLKREIVENKQDSAA